MKKLTRQLHFTLTALVFAAIIASGGQALAQDYEALAERLVQQSADIQEGDKVMVFGCVRDLELL